MASCLEFVVDRKKLWSDIEKLDREAESTIIIHFIAARKIQSWFRGIATRNHFRTLHSMAIIIQRHWREYRARNFAFGFLKDRVNAMWQNHYDRSATIVQSTWRGYRARKNGLDIGRTKNWIASVFEINEKTRKQMRSFRETQLEHTRNEIERESLLWILFILFKLHHLLGTKNCPGVLTSIDRTRTTEIEKMIKCLEYSVHVEKTRLEKMKKMDWTVRDGMFCMLGRNVKTCDRFFKHFENFSKKSSTLKSKKDERKWLQARVENLAKTMWGDNYRETFSQLISQCNC